MTQAERIEAIKALTELLNLLYNSDPLYDEVKAKLNQLIKPLG